MNGDDPSRLSFNVAGICLTISSTYHRSYQKVHVILLITSFPTVLDRPTCIHTSVMFLVQDKSKTPLNEIRMPLSVALV